MNRLLKIVLLIIVGTLLATLAWGAQKTEVYTATVDSKGVQKIEMLAGEFYFKPNDVIVKKNVPVEISIKKEPGYAAHSLVLHAPETGIDLNVALGTDAKTIRFTPTKAGKYAFYCDKGLIEKHRAKGMEGVLEVTE